MKKLLFMTVALLSTMMISAQTIFSFSVDTVVIEKADSVTFVGNNKDIVFNVGDTVRANQWLYSTDSVTWRRLRDNSGVNVAGDSVLLDTLPLYKYYAARLRTNTLGIDTIIWKVDTVLYTTLTIDSVYNDESIDKTSIKLLSGDTIDYAIDFNYSPDTVIWYKNGIETLLPISESGKYIGYGYKFNRDGQVITSVQTEEYDITFLEVTDAIIFSSWADQYNGEPDVDTMYLDQYPFGFDMDTLVMAVGIPYKYTFAPKTVVFDKSYSFNHRWTFNGFSNIPGRILTFNPLEFKHSGYYNLVITTANYTFTSAPITFVAHNVSNEIIMDSYVNSGVIYNMSGQLVRVGVKGYIHDIVKNNNLPQGTYVLVYNDITYKFAR